MSASITAEPPEAQSGDAIAAVERALLIIEDLADIPAGRPLSDIARRLGVNKAIATRLLISLDRAG